MKQQTRLWGIDFLRGVAILLMVAFHLMLDLTEFYGFKFNYLSGFWYYEGKFAAFLFVWLAGISSVFSRSNIRRGLVVLGWGMLLTVATYVYNPSAYIRFGILHLLGSSMLLYQLFGQLSSVWLGLISLLLIGMGQVTYKISTSSQLLIPLGIIPAGFTSLDYYPLLPWLGVFMFGMLCGRYIYPKTNSFLSAPDGVGWLTYLGRHSLLIYLVHQPVLLAGLYVFYKILGFK